MYGVAIAWLLVAGLAGEAFGEAAVLVPMLFLVISLLALSPWSIRRIALGRRMRAPRAFDLLQRQSGLPVLLLRSFDDDDLIDASYSATNQTVPARTEERLVAALKGLGPTIALGRPGEPQPMLGAARLYVEDEDWQRAVLHFMDRAVAVVAVVGPTEGLWWEIGAAIKHVPPQRLLLFFPYPVPAKVRESWWRRSFMQNPFTGKFLRRTYYATMEQERQERFRAFRERFASHFQHPLPEALENSRFLQFDVAGHPELLPPRKPGLLVRILTMNWRSQIDVPFARELRPFVTNLTGS